jgi:hypothetical protein
MDKCNQDDILPFPDRIWLLATFKQFALDIIPFFADNTPNILKAVTEESTSVEAAREVWSTG